MLQSKEEIDPQERFTLRMELPEEMDGSNQIIVDAESRWDKKEENALFHHTGFEFLNIPQDEEARVRKLMESYKLEGFPG